MSALMRGIARIASLFRRSSLDHDLQAELDSHLTLAQDDHLRQGRSPAEARARAHRDLGALGSAAEGHRDARGWPSLDTLRQDVVYALRSFAKTPGFTAIAVIMLALGIGANTAVFSVVNPMMLRPLPFPEPNELVWLTKNGEGLSARTYRADAFESLQRNNRSFAEVSGYFAFFGYLTYKLTGSGGAEGFVGVPMAPRFFELLGVKPELGRHFSKEELQTKGPKAALLTHSLWQRRFNADPALVGQSVTLNGDPVRVVGVLPADFDFSAVFTPGVHVDLFVPAHLDDMRKWGNILSIVGRLKPGTTIASAQAEMNVLTPALERAAPEVGEMRVQVSSLKSYVSGTMHRSLIVLWAAVGLVLLIACANLSHLLLARTAARSKEIAVRIALGAGRTRIVRQLLTEGVVLAVVGAAVGVPLAYGLTWYLTNKAGLSLPLLNRVQVDGAALGFTMATAVIAGLVFGLMPALRVSRRDPQTVLKDQSRGSTDSPAQRTIRSALVVAEIALACVLLVGAGLLVKSFIQLLDIDLGFAPTRSMAIRLDLGDAKITSSEQKSAMLAEIARRASALPGVQAAGLPTRCRSIGIGPGISLCRVRSIQIISRRWRSSTSPDPAISMR